MTLNRKPQAGALNRSASEQAHWSMLFLHVFLTMLLVRISLFREAFSRNNADKVIQLTPSAASTHCHPELVSGSFSLLGGRWTVDGQRCLHSDQRILASLQRFFYNDANHSRGEVEKLITVGVPSVSGRETGTISKVKSQPGSRSRAVSISV